MTAPVLHCIRDHHFWLSPERVLYWEEEKTLILSDLHFGKTGHFRKSGIAVPQSIYQQDLQRLFHQISFFNPEKILIVGDFFHSIENKEMDFFLKWRNDLSALPMILVKGNHDILQKEWYRNASVDIVEQFQLNSFLFIHDNTGTTQSEDVFVFSGHLHPGCIIRGAGKQSLRFPCFYFTEQQAILPAFSHFSGLTIVQAKKNDHVFAIVNQSIIKIQ
ncbi:ligase-associated DNA damage response endonuclease PdeM [Sediminibacterium sp.]|uniref:ligase-associated DNA damage response endonuclease PdeM n=1 Tax=Sediminibacterium sp. TaxID=1917865 RepID=UPI0025E3CC38|nr:ligase-associated DNA damage response endonuclease PdeM [Sediminibacterium sp.]MBW0176518.1 ligase-associated DNA damage response endonuclease PdeM [Sediminibacterium sp.]